MFFSTGIPIYMFIHSISNKNGVKLKCEELWHSGWEQGPQRQPDRKPSPNPSWRCNIVWLQPAWILWSLGLCFSSWSHNSYWLSHWTAVPPPPPLLLALAYLLKFEDSSPFTNNNYVFSSLLDPDKKSSLHCLIF